MNYDFSKVAREAARVASSEKEHREFKYKIVYPGEGKIKFRILFNPQSGQIWRLISRHNIEGKKIPCAATYSHKDNCPICKALSDISNMGQSYPREYSSKTRAILFAQFCSADYEVANGNIKKGDIFLLMVPWTVYKQICKWVADFSSDAAIMAKVFGSHEGYVQVIEKGKDANDWTFRPDPNITLESAKTDDEFSEMLDGIESLYDQMGFHQECTPEETALMQTTAAQLIEAYISPSSAQGYIPPTPPTDDVNPQAFKNPTPVTQAVPAVEVATPVAPQSYPTAPQLATRQPKTPEPATQPVASQPQEVVQDKPACYGGYVPADDQDPSHKAASIRCKYCPMSQQCQSDSVPF